MNVLVDKESAGKVRPRREEMLVMAKHRKFDVLVFWSLDRLARATGELILTADELHGYGVELVSIHDPIDTTSAAGRLAFQVLGAVAEFERRRIRERVVAGIAAARARGVRLGRPPEIEDEKKECARALLGKMSVSAIAHEVGLSAATVQRLKR